MTRFIPIAAIALLATAPAHAGETVDAPVTVNLSTQEAYGTLGSTRSSADTVNYLGCKVRSIGSSSTGWCSARQGNVAVYCTTTDATLIDVIRSLRANHGLNFRWASGTFQCVSIGMSAFSTYEPAVP